jgi:hypothetical protein
MKKPSPTFDDGGTNSLRNLGYQHLSRTAESPRGPHCYCYNNYYYYYYYFSSKSISSSSSGSSSKIIIIKQEANRNHFKNNFDITVIGLHFVKELEERFVSGLSHLLREISLMIQYKT